MKPRILAGLIGSGIQASRTPALHEQEGDARGLRYLYRLIDLDPLRLTVDALPDLLDAAELMQFTGLNITYPCKQAILPLLDDLSDEARGLARSIPWCSRTANVSAITPTAWASPKGFDAT